MNVDFPNRAGALLAALDDAAVASVRETMTEVLQDWIRHGPEIPDTTVPKGQAVDARKALNFYRERDGDSWWSREAEEILEKPQAHEE